MRLTEKLRRTFWFLTRRARDTKRWGDEQTLQLDEAFDRVAAAGSLSAARTALERERADTTLLRAHRRMGLLGAKPAVTAAKPVFASEPERTILLDFIAANPDFAAVLGVDVTKPELLTAQLDRLLSNSKPDRVDSRLDRPVNSSTSGARLASSR